MSAARWFRMPLVVQLLLLGAALGWVTPGCNSTQATGGGSEGEGEGQEGEGEPEGASEGEGETEGTTSPGEGEGEGSTPRPDCRQDPTLCSGNTACNRCLGLCVEVAIQKSCTRDENCGLADYCDPCTGYCQRRIDYCGLCGKDHECQKGGIRGEDRCYPMQTSGLRCLKACISDLGCPPCYTCQAIPDLPDQKLCLPRTGECNQPCECLVSAECEEGFYCNDRLGVCAPGCYEDGSCPLGQVCSDYQCQPPCTGPQDCPTGAECTEDGHCRVPGGCLTSRDCPELGTYCDPDELMCKSGCLINNDCGRANLVCQDHQCVEKGCEGNYSCAFGQVCNFDTKKCEDAGGLYCTECDAQGQNQCGGDPNLCVTFNDEDGNALGDYCLVVCGPDPANPCPQGYACRELQDQNGSSVGSFCERACPIRPVVEGQEGEGEGADD